MCAHILSGDARCSRQLRLQRRRPGFPVEGDSARASLGAALGVGRPTSKYLQDRGPCTVSKVWCLRPLRTSLLSCVVGVSVAALRNDARLQLLKLACDVLCEVGF